MSKLIEVTPLPKMGESLRALGYSAKTAIADIVDNCIDADGRDIRVEILGTESNKRSPPNEVSIFDNGWGMTGEQLNDALTLGTESHKSASSLGCFGMGLKTAGTSLGRRITVFSRKGEGEPVCRVLDLDVNLEEKRFVVEDRSPTLAEIERFNTAVGGPGHSGTWICITEIDSEEYATVHNMLQGIRGKKALRLLFRKFLAAGTRTITINDKPLQPWGYEYVEGVEILHEPWPFILDDGTNLGTLKLISTLDTEHKAGHSRTQGLVVVRNNRDITTHKPDWHGVHSHHWELSGVYLVWEVNSSTFDAMMSTTLMKDGWRLPQNIRDALTAEVSSDLRAYMKRRENDRKANKKSDTANLEERLKSYQNNLNNNMNTTRKPEVHNEQFHPAGDKSKEASETDNSDKPTKERKSRKPFTYAGEGLDEFEIKVDSGCGNGRHFQLAPGTRKQRGGRRYHLSVDTDHPWVAKYFVGSDTACNSEAFYVVCDNIIGDAYMEMKLGDMEMADQAIRLKSDFLRTRALVTTTHETPVDMAAK
jgi:hypothetical protein